MEKSDLRLKEMSVLSGKKLWQCHCIGDSIENTENFSLMRLGLISLLNLKELRKELNNKIRQVEIFFIAYFPREVLWDPFFHVYQRFWRLKRGYL